MKPTPEKLLAALSAMGLGLSVPARETVRRAYAGEAVSPTKYAAIVAIARDHGLPLPPERVPTLRDQKQAIKRVERAQAVANRLAERDALYAHHEKTLGLAPGSIRAMEAATEAATAIVEELPEGVTPGLAAALKDMRRNLSSP